MAGILTSGPAAPEIISIVYAALLVWASALVQHLGNTVIRGPGYVVGDRAVAPDMSGFFGRATRTLANNVESALMYIPPTLLIVILRKEGVAGHYPAYVYMIARSVYTLSYWLKIPVIRSLAWLTGMICCAVMFAVAASAAG